MTSDQQRALHIALDSALAVGTDLVRAEELGRALDGAATNDVFRGLLDDFDSVRKNACTSAASLDHHLGRVAVGDGDLSPTHLLTGSLRRILDKDLLYTCDISYARDYDLRRAIGLTADLARILQDAVGRMAEPGQEQFTVPRDDTSQGRSQARPATSACRLVALTTRLLPTPDQARYGEEWRSELHDLATGGAGRGQQLGYTVRLLVRVLPVRLAVLAPRREKASS